MMIWRLIMKQKRWSKILEICESNNIVSVNELINHLNVSEATIRRDLQNMEDNNLIVRFHGGAKLNENSNIEKSMSMKTLLNIEEKNYISTYAASLIKDGDIVFLDAGSTTYNLIDHIKAKDITIVTIGIPHLSKLSQKEIKTFVVSGFVKSSTVAVTGKETVNQISKMVFDIAFIGTNGIHTQAGFTTPEEYEGEVKSMVIEKSKESYILADSSKFNKLYFVKFATLDEVKVITDKKIDNFDYSLIDCIFVGENVNS